MLKRVTEIQKMEILSRNEVHQIFDRAGHEVEPRGERRDNRPRLAQPLHVEDVDVTDRRFAMSQDELSPFLERHRGGPLYERRGDA